MYEVSPENKLCDKYQIVDYDSIQYKYVGPVAWQECQNIFGFTYKDIPKVMNWARDANDYSKEHCK